MIENGPFGESCTGNSTLPDKCFVPIIPKCIDRNFYCELPPKTPLKSTRSDIYISANGWLNVPGTKLSYVCNNASWAFNYKTDPKMPSFYFTENINNITITCNKYGYSSLIVSIQNSRNAQNC